MIEISLRDCQLDDYDVTVPTPVYCDYRLPGYDDVFMSRRQSGSQLTIERRLGSNHPSRSSSNRYLGEPPAYESASEDDERYERISVNSRRSRNNISRNSSGVISIISLGRNRSLGSVSNTSNPPRSNRSSTARTLQPLTSLPTPEMSMVPNSTSAELSSIVVTSVMGENSSPATTTT
jgi:hypothetical protein